MKKLFVSLIAMVSMFFVFASGSSYADEVHEPDYVLLKNEKVDNQFVYFFNKNISYEINDNGDVIVYDRVQDKEFLLPKNGEVGNAFGTFSYRALNEYSLVVEFNKIGEFRSDACVPGFLGSYYAGLVAGAGSGASIASALALVGGPAGWLILGAGTIAALAGGATGFAAFCQ